MKIIITDDAWNHIRSAFNDGERDQLNKAASGKVICPSGVRLNLLKLDPEVRIKVIKMM